MATQTHRLAGGPSEPIELSIDYDDVSNVIGLVRFRNDGAFGNATVTLMDRSTRAVVYGPVTRGFGTGTFTQNVASAGLHMVTIPPSPKGGGPGLAPPFDISLEWANTAAKAQGIPA